MGGDQPGATLQPPLHCPPPPVPCGRRYVTIDRDGASPIRVSVGPRFSIPTVASWGVCQTPPRRSTHPLRQRPSRVTRRGAHAGLSAAIMRGRLWRGSRPASSVRDARRGARRRLPTTRELSPGGQGRIDADWTRYEEKSDEGQTTSTHVRAHLVRGTVRAASALASGTAPIGDAHSPDRHEPRIVSYQTRVMEEHKDHGCSSTPTFVRSRFRLC